MRFCKRLSLGLLPEAAIHLCSLQSCSITIHGTSLNNLTLPARNTYKQLYRDNARVQPRVAAYRYVAVYGRHVKLTIKQRMHAGLCAVEQHVRPFTGRTRAQDDIDVSNNSTQDRGLGAFSEN